MRAAIRVLVLAGVLALGACSSGETTVTGVDGGATGATSGTTAATGATGATAASGATGSTSVTGAAGGLEGAVSLDIPAGRNPTGAGVYSCDGVEGTWIYEAGAVVIEGLDMDFQAEPFSMAGGQGTLVIVGTVAIPGSGEAGFTDTVQLEIQGPADAPVMTSTGVQVEVSGVLEGIPVSFGDFFPENASFPVVPGAPQC